MVVAVAVAAAAAAAAVAVTVAASAAVGVVLVPVPVLVAVVVVMMSAVKVIHDERKSGPRSQQIEGRESGNIPGRSHESRGTGVVGGSGLGPRE